MAGTSTICFTCGLSNGLFLDVAELIPQLHVTQGGVECTHDDIQGLLGVYGRRGLSQSLWSTTRSHLGEESILVQTRIRRSGLQWCLGLRDSTGIEGDVWSGGPTARVKTQGL